MTLTGLLVVIVVVVSTIFGLEDVTCPEATLTPNGLNTFDSEFEPMTRGSTKDEGLLEVGLLLFPTKLMFWMKLLLKLPSSRF